MVFSLCDVAPAGLSHPGTEQAPSSRHRRREFCKRGVTRLPESLAQKSECARYTGQRHDHVLPEAEPAVGHVDAFTAVLLDELVDVGDGRILIVHGVVQVHGGRGRGLTEPDRLEGGAHPWYLEHARDGEVVAQAKEREAHDELL